MGSDLIVPGPCRIDTDAAPGVMGSRKLSQHRSGLMLKQRRSPKRWLQCLAGSALPCVRSCAAVRLSRPDPRGRALWLRGGTGDCRVVAGAQASGENSLCAALMPSNSPTISLSRIHSV